VSAIALQRSKKYLEQKGWHVWIVEHFNQWAHVRQDLYGFGDLVAIRHDSNGVWAINACTDEGEVKSHIDKYLNGYDNPKKGRQPPNPHLPVWLASKNRFSLFGWGKRNQGGIGSRKVWTLRIIEFYLNGAEVKWQEIL
jgi:hypothetical protein